MRPGECPLLVREPTEDRDMSRLLEELAKGGDSPLMSAYPTGSVFVFDRDLRYVAAGGEALARRGRTRHDLEGLPIDEALSPATLELTRPLYLAALRGESSTTDVPVA